MEAVEESGKIRTGGGTSTALIAHTVHGSTGSSSAASARVTAGAGANTGTDVLFLPEEDYANLDDGDALVAVGDDWGVDWMVPEPAASATASGAGSLAGYCKPDWELEAEARQAS